MTLPISTPRLTIRPFTDEDLPVMREIFFDPEVMRFIAGGARDDQGSAERLQSLIRHHRDHGVSKWAVEITATHQLIGDRGLQFLDDGPDLELGFHLGRPHWGQAFATEAARACLSWARSNRAERIVAIVDPAHVASQRVLERIGMRHHGLREHLGQTWLFYTDLGASRGPAYRAG